MFDSQNYNVSYREIKLFFLLVDITILDLYIIQKIPNEKLKDYLHLVAALEVHSVTSGYPNEF